MNRGNNNDLSLHLSRREVDAGGLSSPVWCEAAQRGYWITCSVKPLGIVAICRHGRVATLPENTRESK